MFNCNQNHDSFHPVANLVVLFLCFVCFLAAMVSGAPHKEPSGPNGEQKSLLQGCHGVSTDRVYH